MISTYEFSHFFTDNIRIITPFKITSINRSIVVIISNKINKASKVSIDENRIIEDIIAEDFKIIENNKEKFNQELELLIN